MYSSNNTLDWPVRVEFERLTEGISIGLLLTGFVLGQSREIIARGDQPVLSEIFDDFRTSFGLSPKVYTYNVLIKKYNFYLKKIKPEE